ncbi:MAG: hypothetical protein KAT70_07260, partial [Thermoplasmata archaeon]|nr:hypothetical protein [Thermoplasmata archaeon]
AWSQAASMTHARYGHTTTSQYGGNLVVIGGKDETANGYMLPIEIYDPWNDEWTTKGNLTLGRAFHTSTLLENGRVLITGGVTTAFAQKTAICEEYSEDWEEGQYVCLATEDRAFHTAILLPDGYVLVAGGEDDVGVLKTCELFEGGWGKWYELTGINPTDSLYDVSYDPNVENYYLVGNDSTGNGVVYTLPSGTLRTTRASIGPNILGAAYCSSDHKTYLYNDSGYLQPMEPSSSSQQSMWNNIPGFPTKPGPRHAHCMAFGAEKALAVMFGGSNAGGVLQETWLYSPFVNTWTNMTGPGSPPAREAASLCFSNETDLFYLYGGFGSNYLNDTWTYDPFTNVWTNITGGTNPPHISNHGMVFDHVNKYIWLFGGRDGAQRYNDTWRLDPNTGIWTMMPQPPSFIKKMFGHAMIWDPVENVVVVFGGRDTA